VVAENELPPLETTDARRDLLCALTPTAERLLERHLGAAKEWFPHEHVPWSRGRDFEPGWTWKPSEAPDAADAVRSSLLVNLLTEDNLPYYFRTIESMFGRDGAWGSWSRRWTAEEGRHSIVIRDYLLVTRMIDPVELERGRMAQVSLGITPEPPDPLDGLVYVALQELATRIAHLNTGKSLTDPVGYDIMKRVAADENLHHLFYRDLISAALDMNPSEVIPSIERQVRNFEMPGVGIPNFGGHARTIAAAGIYDLSIHHDQILVPTVLRHWNVAAVTGLTPESEQALEALLERIERTGRAGRHMTERRLARNREDGMAQSAAGV